MSFIAGLLLAISIFLFGMDINSTAPLSWIHYLVPLSVGFILAGSLIMIIMENKK
jgi:ABC-type multidrug transport system permease subunit